MTEKAQEARVARLGALVGRLERAGQGMKAELTPATSRPQAVDGLSSGLDDVQTDWGELPPLPPPPGDATVSEGSWGLQMALWGLRQTLDRLEALAVDLGRLVGLRRNQAPQKSSQATQQPGKRDTGSRPI